MSDGQIPPIPQGAPAPPPKTRFANSVGSGVVLCFLMHLLIQLPLAVFTMLVSTMGIFLTQLFYVVPLVVRAHRTARPELAKGLWIGAGISALLNVMCTGLFWSNFRIQ